MGNILRPRERVRIFSYGSAVGHDEYRGPLGALFDYHDENDRFGADTWEKAEGELGRMALGMALNRAGLPHTALDLLLAGDLQNQCVASSGGLSALGLPYLGLYGACSTFVEGLVIAAMALSCKDLFRVGVVTTSHNCAAERQFRLPLEYGGQRTPTAQWTATAGGCVLLERGEGGVCLDRIMPGRMVDGGISDAANMGAAMAPAAADSILRFLDESGEVPEDYDAIVTGDLGEEGSGILADLLAPHGVPIKTRHRDCGVMLYDPERQDVHAGGSGCGCIASVSCAYFIPKMEKREMKRILLAATGALMSPSSIRQGGSIIGIAPIVSLEVLA